MGLCRREKRPDHPPSRRYDLNSEQPYDQENREYNRFRDNNLWRRVGHSLVQVFYQVTRVQITTNLRQNRARSIGLPQPCGVSGCARDAALHGFLFWVRSDFDATNLSSRRR